MRPRFVQITLKRMMNEAYFQLFFVYFEKNSFNQPIEPKKLSNLSLDIKSSLIASLILAMDWMA